MKSVEVPKLVEQHYYPFYTTYPKDYHQHLMLSIRLESFVIRMIKRMLESVDNHIFVQEIQQNSVPSTNADNFQFLSYIIQLSCDRLYFRHEPKSKKKKCTFWSKEFILGKNLHPNACRRPAIKKEKTY